MRVAHTFSKTLEYFSEKELSLQIGSSREQWPQILVRELIDNALDACEASGIAPKIVIDQDAEYISVKDNGPGIPPDVVARIIDYTTRTSSNALWPTPSRGQLGNAMKCLLAVPFVWNGDEGLVEINSKNIKHTIRITLNQIKREPVIDHIQLHHECEGTEIIVYITTDTSLVPLVERMSICNPHATISHGDHLFLAVSEKPGKWKGSDPVPPHWFTSAQFSNLIAAEIFATPDKSLRDFLEQFRGMRSNADRSAVLSEAMLPGSAKISTLSSAETLDHEAINNLHGAMVKKVRPVSASNLGCVGKAAIEDWTGDIGRATYKKILVEHPSHPYVIEVCLCVMKKWEQGRVVFCSTNFSANLGIPYPEIYQAMDQNRINQYDPVLVWVHVIGPNIPWSDHGKTQANLHKHATDAIFGCLESVSREWQKKKRQSDRDGRLGQKKVDEFIKNERKKLPSIKEAAWACMEEAYALVSDDGALPVYARQMMYACRPHILEMTDRDSIDDQYFTQTLLPDFSAENPELTRGWEVTYDARGHINEPHSKRVIPLGTLEVRGYVRKWSDARMAVIEDELPIVLTSGPQDRFGAVLFIEKEGFIPLLEREQIMERYDIAVMSTKGMSNTSARELVESLSNRGIKILVAHDFDKSGFDICAKLSSDTRRFSFDDVPHVIDIGLRLDDVRRMNLQSESVTYVQEKDPREILRQQGCTDEESNFLVEQRVGKAWKGQRVELNAMTSRQLLDWLEEKFKEHGVTKVLPSADKLEEAFHHTNYVLAVSEAIKSVEPPALPVPDDLQALVAESLRTNPSIPWNEAVREICRKSF